MPDEKITTNQITLGILFLIIILAGYIGADAIIQWRKNKITPQPIEKSADEKIAEIIENTEVKTPEKEFPPEDEYDGIGGLTQYLQKINLITSPYIPTADVYADSNTYRETVPRLGLKGEFEVAALLIKGEISNDLVNFLSVNIGKISGTY